MRVDETIVTALTIYGLPIGAITVVMRDTGPGCGLLIVECNNRAWSARWKAMGTHLVGQFVIACDAGYIASELLGPWHADDAVHVLRIVRAVQAGLQIALVTPLAEATHAGPFSPSDLMTLGPHGGEQL